MDGNDLIHLVEGNQAGLFRITRPYLLPPPHTNIFYIPNIKALDLVISDKFFSLFSLNGLCETCASGRAHFVPEGHNLNILGRGQLGDAT